MRVLLSMMLCIALLTLAGYHAVAASMPPTQAASILTFKYDAARDVVIAHTTPVTYVSWLSAKGYASALANLPEASYVVSPRIKLTRPIPKVGRHGELTVNYQTAVGLRQLSSAQSTGLLAVLEAWWWVPGVKTVHLRVAGKPVRTLGPIAISDPLRRGYHTYVVQPQTGEVGYLSGALIPKTPGEALTILQRREISEFPASQGFRPILPEGVTLTSKSKQTDRVFRVNLSRRFPSAESARIAGVVLMLTQFPSIDAVRFTIAGATRNGRIMRGNLNAPITPQLLLLPSTVASVATGTRAEAIAAAIRNYSPQAPSSIEDPLVWQDWAMTRVTVDPAKPARLFILHESAGGYSILLVNDRLEAKDLLAHRVSRDAITAFRIDGWEGLLP